MTAKKSSENKNRKVYSESCLPPRQKSSQGGPSKTKQEFKDKCDIKSIMQRYRETGRMPNSGKPMFGDFSKVQDFSEAKLMISQALEQFQYIPSDIRAKFDNDPQKLINFLDNEENREEAEALGLLEPQKQAVEAEKAPEESPTPEPTPKNPEEPEKGKGKGVEA